MGSWMKMGVPEAYDPLCANLFLIKISPYGLMSGRR